MAKDKRVFPECEDDIFISYAHLDNQPREQGHYGWIDSMHFELGRRLAEVLGVPPKIWRDPKLPANNPWRLILLKLENVAIMVAVLSPRYVQSDSCRKEVKEFYHRARQLLGVRRDTQERIFKVIKTPINEDDQPFELTNSRGYRFYDLDQTTGKRREFSHEARLETYPKFLDKLEDLVLDIEEFVSAQRTTPSGRLVMPTGKTVYLAETAADADSQRDQIKRELQSFGYLVLPEKDFPRDSEKRVEAIQEDLQRSDLSIHLIGKMFDGVEPSFVSLVRLQHELALKRRGEANFEEIIWIPKGLTVDDPNQKKLIEDLRRDANTYVGIELLQDMREDLKTNVLNKLKRLEKPTSPASPPPGTLPIEGPKVSAYGEKDKVELPPEPEPPDPLYVYLINDYQEYEATLQLRNFLFDQKNIEVFQILTEHEPSKQKSDNVGQAEAVMQLQKYYLNECDAAIIFQGGASDVWRELKLCELRRSVVGRSKDLLGRLVYLGDPMSKTKEMFRSNEATIVRDEGTFRPEKLLPFIEGVKARASARKAKVKGAGQ